jgi:hypothetical protein
MTNDEPQATTTDSRAPEITATTASATTNATKNPREPKTTTKSARIFVRIFLIALSIVFALACAEVAMRLLDKPRAAVSG